MIAQYDMAFRLSTYDVVNWIAHVKVLGASEIVFKIDQMRLGKWSPEESLRRFHNYIHPMPALFELPCRIGKIGDAQIGSHQVYDLHKDMLRLGIDVPRMRSVLPPAKERYTVTIRETFHNKHKNSDRELWLCFAERIGARVIEDTARAPISLYERIALYAGARMNFGVPNGPMAMMYYSGFPFRIMADPAVNAKSFGGHKIGVGDQIPWLLPYQRIVWERANMDNLMREVEQMEAAA